MKKNYTANFKMAIPFRFLLITVLCLGAGKGWGQTTYTWDGSTTASTTGSNVNITSAAFNSTQGNNNGTTTLISTTSPSSGYAGATGTSNFGAACKIGALSTSTSTYFSVVITPAAGYQLTLNSISLGSRGTSTGPLAITIYSSIDGYASAIGSAVVLANSAWALSTISSFSGSLIGATGTPVTLRIYGSGGAGSPSANTANWRIDDISLSVTATVPSAPTFSFGGAGLTAFSTLVNVPSGQQSYTISGLNLTPNQANGISITAPADFEVSLTNNTFTGINGNTVTLSSNGTGNIVGEPVSVYVRYFPAASGTTLVNISSSGAGVSTPQTQAVSGISTAYFYSKATGDLTDPATFNSAADGSGTDATNFTNNNQTFEIRNRAAATITANWVVSGTSSKIVVGTGSDLTIPSTNTITGTIDVSAGRQLILQNSTLPTMGSMASGSTVEYAQTTATTIANTTTGLATYANLKLSGSGIKTFDHAVTTVTGNLTYDGTTNGPLTVEAAGTSAFTTINLAGDLTYLGSVTNPIDLDAYTLVTTSTGTQTITGNGNTARFFKLTCNSSGNNVILSTSGGSTNLHVGNLSNSGGVQLNTGTTLNLNGNTATFFAAGGGLISGAGTITGSPTSSIVINRAVTGAFGTINFTLGSRSLNNLTINHTGAATPTVTLGSALDIYGTLTVTAGTLALGNNNLTLKSTVSGTARVASPALPTPFTYGTGKFVVERYIANAGHRAWHLLGVPVTGTQTIYDSWQEGGVIAANLGTLITSPAYDGANGFDISSNSASILTHNQAGPAWVSSMPNTNTTILSSNPGYMLFVRGDRNYTPTSPSPTATNETVLRSSGSLRTGAQAAVTVSSSGTGRTLVGNPFASPVDFESIYATSNLDQSFYMWDPTMTGNFGVGGFRLVERMGLDDYQATPSIGVSEDNSLRYIHSGQAIFLKASGVDASVVFDENSKASLVGVTNPLVNPKGGQQIYVNLMIKNAGSPSLADGIRIRYDAAFSAGTTDDILKMSNFGESLSSLRENQKLIVEKRPMIKATDTIFLRMTNTAVKDYSFRIGSIDFVQTGIRAWLQDTYTGKNTALELNGNANDIDFSITADAGSANTDRFRIIFTGKAQLPVITASDKPGITVYPSPVTNRIIGLHFTGMSAGIYNVRLVNTNGQVVLTQQFTHDGYSATQNIKLGAGVTGGLYRLEIINPDRTRTSKNIIVSN